MNKNDYSNLRNKTIFDLCDDEEILYDLTVSKELYYKNLEEYPLLNAYTLLEYAELTRNKELRKAVLLEYRKEMLAEINE